MALAFTLFDSSTLAGLLSPALFLIAIALGAWAYARVHISKAQDQAILTWRQNAEAMEERAEIAQARYEVEREAKHAALAELAAEKMKTDQTVVLAEIVRFHQEFANREVLFHKIFDELTRQRADVALGLKAMEVQVKAMEERLVTAISKQTEALDLIADKMNGNGH